MTFAHRCLELKINSPVTIKTELTCHVERFKEGRWGLLGTVCAQGTLGWEGDCC